MVKNNNKKVRLKNGQELIFACCEDPLELWKFVHNIRRSYEESASKKKVTRVKVGFPEEIFEDRYYALILRDSNELPATEVFQWGFLYASQNF